MKIFNRIPWDDRIELGDKSIDSDHKYLLSLYNRLVDLSKVNYTPADFVEVLSEMTDYSLRHFKEEEKLMADSFFPSLKEHKKEHQDFIYKIALFNMKFNNDANQLNEILEYLQSWWFNHIEIYDKEIVKYINDNNK